MKLKYRDQYIERKSAQQDAQESLDKLTTFLMVLFFVLALLSVGAAYFFFRYGTLLEVLISAGAFFLFLILAFVFAGAGDHDSWYNQRFG